ncbi:hypothetical protein LG943_20935 [Streptomonospora sp. S1-112]|uniref:Uncharacterized protein n=1 Tax=Streptomonospora mangrovi TaxID=2883123 RepID=A0A9X3SGC8_9ACTN|nr:hypothetical protein [Streptomonospora mangrovi]MDA0566757.1 hypothetical protein [Streptomonospora mangrovi]
MYALGGTSVLAVVFALAWAALTDGMELAGHLASVVGALTAVAAFFGQLARKRCGESSAGGAAAPAAAPAADAVVPPGGQRAGRDNYSGSRVSHNSGLVVFGVVAVVALAVVGVNVLPAEGDGLTTCERPAPLDGNTLRTRMATVVYTEGLGFMTRCGPGTEFAAGAAQDLFDGVHVSIVCQEPDGLLVADPENAAFPENYPRESTVWFLLNDGRWISELYVNTPKGRETGSSGSVPVCDGNVDYATTPA